MLAKHIEKQCMTFMNKGVSTCVSLFVHVSGCVFFFVQHKGVRRRRESKSDVFLYHDDSTSGARLQVINV